MSNPRPAQSRALKAWHANRTDEERQATSEKRSQSVKAWYANLTDEERRALAEKLKEARRKKYEENPEAQAAMKRRCSETQRVRIAALSPEKKRQHALAIRRGYAERAPAERESDRLNRSERFKRMWAGRSRKFRKSIAAKQSVSIAKWWANAPPEAHADRARKARLAHPTKPELEMSALLTALGVVFRAEYPIGPYCVDFYVQSRRLVIEVDGEYWHAGPDRIAHDRKRDRTLRALGYQVFRVWAKQVTVPRTRARLLSLVAES